jgi:hypothetical protein
MKCSHSSVSTPRRLMHILVFTVSLLSASVFAQTTASVLRHGQTDWHKDGRIQTVIDNPLNRTGSELQAAR